MLYIHTMEFYEVLSTKLCHLQENFYGDHHVKENKVRKTNITSSLMQSLNTHSHKHGMDINDIRSRYLCEGRTWSKGREKGMKCKFLKRK